jgi:hypothetical protein
VGAADFLLLTRTMAELPGVGNCVVGGGAGKLKLGKCDGLMMRFAESDAAEAVAGKASRAPEARAAPPTASTALAGAVRNTRERFFWGIGTTGATPGRD